MKSGQVIELRGLTFRPLPGQHINEAVQQLILFARHWKVPCRMVFMGAWLEADATTTAETLVEKYWEKQGGQK